MPPKKPINQREEKENLHYIYNPSGPWHYYDAIRCCDGAQVKIYDAYCAMCHDNPMGNWTQDPAYAYITYSGNDPAGGQYCGGIDCCAKIISEGLDYLMGPNSYGLAYYGQGFGDCEDGLNDEWVTLGGTNINCDCGGISTTTVPPTTTTSTTTTTPPGDCSYTVEFSLGWPCGTTSTTTTVPPDCSYTVEFLLEWPCSATTTTTPCPPTFPKPVIPPCGDDGEDCNCEDVREPVDPNEECPECNPCTTTVAPPPTTAPPTTAPPTTAPPTTAPPTTTTTPAGDPCDPQCVFSGSNLGYETLVAGAWNGTDCSGVGGISPHGCWMHRSYPPNTIDPVSGSDPWIEGQIVGCCWYTNGCKGDTYPNPWDGVTEFVPTTDFYDSDPNNCSSSNQNPNNCGRCYRVKNATLANRTGNCNMPWPACMNGSHGPGNPTDWWYLSPNMNIIANSGAWEEVSCCSVCDKDANGNYINHLNATQQSQCDARWQNCNPCNESS